MQSSGQSSDRGSTGRERLTSQHGLLRDQMSTVLHAIYSIESLLAHAKV